MNISIIISLFMVILAEQGESFSYCQESKCGGGAPPVRFPFRLKDRQPEYCGYRGFDLSCTERNNTLLELSNSVKVYVTAIDYVNQVINVSDPDNCIQGLARNISFSGSPFQFYTEYYNFYNISFFNCSKTSARRHCRGGYLVPCLGVPGYEVFALDFSYDLPTEDIYMISCARMYDLSVPYEIFLSKPTNSLELMWTEPACGEREARGRRCRLKSGSSRGGTICIEASKGTRGISIKSVILGTVSFLLALLFVVVSHLYRSHRKEKKNQEKIEKFLEDYEALTLTRFSYADIKRITNQFREKLGQGAYGTVFKGKLSNEILVAVKILNNSTANGEEFINEVATMGTIHHVNVVRLVGFCAEGFRRALVYEFLPNESLEKFIFSNDNGAKNKNIFLGWQKLQDIALGIAKGIQYLHQGCDRRILHFDIKPHNILLDENFTPKISDFGLAKLCSKDKSIISMTTVRGTIGYIAPEVFSRNFGNVSYKSDIYSFGMLLLEMVGGKKNTSKNAEQAEQALFLESIYNHLNRGEELQIQIVEEGDAKIVRKLAIVGLWCIQWCPIDRPSMTNVVQMLDGDGNELVIPPNLFAPTDQRKTDAGVLAAGPIHHELAVIPEIE